MKHWKDVRQGRIYTAKDAKSLINQCLQFDYTKWQENLFEDMSIKEISQKASEYRANM